MKVQINDLVQILTLCPGEYHLPKNKNEHFILNLAAVPLTDNKLLINNLY